jgi:hypothetical protein
MNYIEQVVAPVLAGEVKKATKFVSPKYVIKATALHKLDRRDKINVVTVTAGRPNYAEQKFIRLALRAGEPFPIRKVQLKHFRVA